MYMFEEELKSQLQKIEDSIKRDHEQPGQLLNDFDYAYFEGYADALKYALNRIKESRDKQ